MMHRWLALIITIDAVVGIMPMRAWSLRDILLDHLIKWSKIPRKFLS